VQYRTVADFPLLYMFMSINKGSNKVKHEGKGIEIKKCNHNYGTKFIIK
jgi:hypothetical protein